ncbi:MAG: hypothetical protein B6229_00510 [Spirochaetaceae bacterium 4572_7]|nr:MAG: hypothetical protein B6229_00510 [Spirochaetaceae bacterium 4572_7]
MAKGSNIGFVKKNNIREIQDWMNNYPRKILGGRSPLETLSYEFYYWRLYTFLLNPIQLGLVFFDNPMHIHVKENTNVF